MEIKWVLASRLHAFTFNCLVRDECRRDCGSVHPPHITSLLFSPPSLHSLLLYLSVYCTVCLSVRKCFMCQLTKSCRVAQTVKLPGAVTVNGFIHSPLASHIKTACQAARQEAFWPEGVCIHAMSLTEEMCSFLVMCLFSLSWLMFSWLWIIPPTAPFSNSVTS